MNLKLTLRKSDLLDDWYCIEREEAPGASTEWLEKQPDGVLKFMASARICDADVEGTLEEMLGVAHAIETRGEYAAKRCAVDATGDGVEFWSPRNSMGSGMVTLAMAQELAAKIRQMAKEMAQ